MVSSQDDMSNQSMMDMQGSVDDRKIAINRVGIRAMKHPICFVDRSGEQQSTIADCTMTVHLSETRKGTHMSRFSQLLTERYREVLSIANITDLLDEMNYRLDSPAGTVELTFPYFVNKKAPISGVQGLLDYSVTLRAQTGVDGNAQTWVKLQVPATSLCPCSKAISNYGAHNQRSHIIIEAQLAEHVWVEELIELSEQQASSELYSQLKRSDEKVVTERAYDNPKFVEDIIRDVAKRLNSDHRIAQYNLEVENFESIHNHSAFAVIYSA